MGGSKGGGPAGTTTSTTDTSPWGPQQPYLETGFKEAQRLYEGPAPQYYPGDTYVPGNIMQQRGIAGLYASGAADPVAPTAAEANAGIMGGNYLWRNPSNPVFGSLASTDSPEAMALQSYLSGNRIGQQDPALQSYLSGSRVDRTNPALDPYLSGSRVDRTNPALDPYLSGSRVDRANPALQSYLSGERLGKGNPYTQELTDNVLAKVLPGIQSQFIKGGTLSSPEAMRASASGATSALAPLLFNQQQQEEQNQITAADLYGVQNQRELQNQITAADLYGTQNQRELQNQITAADLYDVQNNRQMQNQLNASDLRNKYGQQEAQNQLAASRQLGEMRLGGAGGLDKSFTGGMNDILRSLALAPTTQDMLYKPYDQIFKAGTAQQQLDQQAINDAVARWNWGQELPYQRYNTYIGGVTGNYGGSAVANTPYFNPQQPSLLSQVGQGVGTAASIFGMFSDRRLKDNIKTVGKLDNGLKVYSYRYKDDPEEMRRIGLMADEVEDVNPEAVMTLPSGSAFGSLGGMKMVDYARATE